MERLWSDCGFETHGNQAYILNSLPKDSRPKLEGLESDSSLAVKLTSVVRETVEYVVPPSLSVPDNVNLPPPSMDTVKPAAVSLAIQPQSAFVNLHYYVKFYRFQ